MGTMRAASTLLGAPKRLGGGPSTSRPGGQRRLLRASAAAGDDVRSARLARILRQYESAGVERQQQELEEYVGEREAVRGDPEKPGSTRGLRASAGTRATEEVANARIDLYLPMGPNGIRVQNVGLHGNGELQWWALRVKPGREKQVAEALERVVYGMLPSLPPAEEGGEPVERTLEAWLPKKTLKVWNPKTEKMGNKVLRYPAVYPAVLTGGDNGGWVLARFVLDIEIFQRIKLNPSFLGWHHVELFGEDNRGRDGKVPRVFPKPCPQEVLDAVADWEADMEPVEEAAVRAAMDLPVQKAPAWEELEDQPEEWLPGDRGGRGGGRFGEARGGRFGDRGGRGGRFGDRGGRFGDRDGGFGEQRERQGWYEPGERQGQAGERASFGEQRTSRFGEQRDGGFGEQRDGGRSGERRGERGGGFGDSGDRRGGRRERQGAGFYSGEPGERDASPRWQEGGQRERSGGDWQEGGRRERPAWQEGGRPERREAGTASSSEWEDRRGDRGGDRGGRGGRFGERRDDRGGRGGRFGDRDGAPRERRQSGAGWFGGDAAAEPAAGASWYDGGAAAEPAADDVWGGGDAAAPAPAAAAQQQEAELGAFTGWLDTAASAFGAAAEVPAGDATWSWDAAPGAPAAPAAQPSVAGGDAPAAPAVDTTGVWDEPAAGGSWGASGMPADTPFGLQPRQQQDDRRGRRGDDRRWEDRGGGRGGRFGERRDDRGGRSGRFGDRDDRGGRGGRFGDRGGRFGDREQRFGDHEQRGDREQRFGDRGWRGDRFGDREQRGDRDGSRAGGGWFEGGAEAGAGQAQSPADLSWWDSDGADGAGDAEETGFAGVYSGSPDWEGDSDKQSGGRGSDGRSERAGRGGRDVRGSGAWGKVAGEGREGGRGGEASSFDDAAGGGSWEDSAGGSGGGGKAAAGDADAAAAFQPGQQVAVTGGNFRDFEGTVVAAEGGRVTAELDIFGKKTRVELSPGEVTRADE